MCYRQGAETSATSEILLLLAFKPFALAMSLFANFGNLKVTPFLEAFIQLSKINRLYYTTTKLMYMHAFRLRR